MREIIKRIKSKIPYILKPRRAAAGVILIIVSYIFCWPFIGILGALSSWLERPEIINVGGPSAYVASHFILLAGIFLAGNEYTPSFVLERTKSLGQRLLLSLRTQP